VASHAVNITKWIWSRRVVTWGLSMVTLGTCGLLEVLGEFSSDGDGGGRVCDATIRDNTQNH
jgi:hypothetical protein